MFKGRSRTIFFPSKTLIYGISRDDSKKFNIRTCEHMILGQLRIGARATTYAALIFLFIPLPSVIPIEVGVFLSALLLFSGSNQRSRDKVAQLHLISILIPLCLSSLILLIPPYPLHHGRQVVELVKIRNQSTLPSSSVSFCFYAH